MDLGLFLPRQIMNRDVQNYGQIFLKILKSKKKKELHSTVMTIDEATCTLLNGLCNLYTICFEFQNVQNLVLYPTNLCINPRCINVWAERGVFSGHRIAGTRPITIKK